MTHDDALEFVERWNKAGPPLEEIRRAELRNYCHEDHIGEIHSLMQIGGLTRQIRLTSGLVEQQRLFQKARS